jgi:cobalt-zinc-cadmium efflux system membrane fusion protein
VKLRGDVPNPKRVLKAEMFVTARVHVPKAAEPTVSSRAVYLSGDRRFVFVRSGSTFTRREVAVGPEAGGRMAVRSGLAVGDEVAASGNLVLEQMLDDARAVQFIEEKAPAS